METSIQPLVSIVTVSFNSLAGLKQTNASLRAVASLGWETVVIDGQSSDGSRSFLESNECAYSLRLIEPDRGIYDAMNKGINLATGRFVLFLNCGDRLVAKLPLRRLRERLEISERIYVGNLLTDDGGNPQVSQACFSRQFFYRQSLPHQAAFIPRSFFSRLGLYDLSYRYSADQEWFLRALVAGVPFEALNFDVAEYAGGGVSERAENQTAMATERRAMLRRNLGLVSRSILDIVMTLRDVTFRLRSGLKRKIVRSLDRKKR